MCFLEVCFFFPATFWAGFLLSRPASYYSFAGGINWKHVAAQLLLQELGLGGEEAHGGPTTLILSYCIIYILCNKDDLWNGTQQWFVPKTMFFLDTLGLRKLLLQNAENSSRTWSNASCIWESTRSPPGSISSLTSHIIASPIHVAQWHRLDDPRNHEGFGWFGWFPSFFSRFFDSFFKTKNQLLRSFWCLWWQLGGHHLHDSDTIGHCSTPGAGQCMVWSSNKANVYYSNQQNTLKTRNDFLASFWCTHLMYPEVLHDLRKPLCKLVTTPSLKPHRCLLDLQIDPPDHDTEACVDPFRVCPSLGRSFQAKFGDSRFKNIQNINHMSFFVSSEMLSRSFKVNACVDERQMSSNVRKLGFGTAADHHVHHRLRSTFPDFISLGMLKSQGREMPKKMWMLHDAGSQAFCLQLRPPLHVLGLGSWYVQAGLPWDCLFFSVLPVFQCSQGSSKSCW